MSKVDEKPKKHFKLGALKNWLILGVAGVAGYWAYKKFIAPELKNIKADVKNIGKKLPPGPDLNGPVVSQYEIASTRSNTCISTPMAGMSYAPITSFNQLTGYQTFSATVAGHFTRRLLCSGGRRWAEIKPGI